MKGKNEPTKKEIAAAVRKRFPESTAINLNQRKHRLRIFFGKPPKVQGSRALEASSHRELLEMIPQLPDTFDELEVAQR